MQKNGEDINSLTERDVFYFIRGRENGDLKACLTHGSFFETVKADNLISQSFYEYIDEMDNINIKEKLKSCLIELFKNPNLRKPNINNASVKLRFIPEAEVKAEGNILNSNKYPEIKDNTLNFVLPCHDDDEKADSLKKMQIVFGGDLDSFRIFKTKHHFNGYFLVFQTDLNMG